MQKARVSMEKENITRVQLTVAQWMQMRKDAPELVRDTPAWLTVTGCSMLPFVRPYRDRVMIRAVEPHELREGDIVLFPGHYLGGDYCLHRLYKIDNQRVQTFGDGNLRPDHWQPIENILGKAELIERGPLTIRCHSPRWQRLFRLWHQLLPLRWALLLPFRVENKIRHLYNG